MELSGFAERLTTTLKRRGVSPKDVFAEFDRGCTGFLTQNYFRKALLSTGCYCTEKDFNIIEGNYSENGGINYARFCDDISGNSPITASRTTGLQTIKQQDLLKFGQQLHTLGINVFDVMKDYDQHHLGIVPITIFFQAFGSSSLTLAIARAYANQSQDINYVQLQHDIDYLFKTMTVSNVVPRDSLPPFFDQFVQHIRSHSIELLDTFYENDPYRKGFISRESFLCVIASFRFPLSPDQLQLLADSFASEGGIDYISLCETVNSHLANLPTFCTKSIGANQPSLLEPLIQEIIHNIRVRHINLRDQIEAAAERYGNELTQKEFYRAMLFANFHLSIRDQKALDQVYLNEDGTFDYRSFLDRVDPARPVQTLPQCEELLVQLKSHLAARKQVLRPLFASFDMEQSGTVSPQQLTSVLSSVGFKVSVAEAKIISQEFGSVYLVNYKQLCERVDPQLAEKPKVQTYFPGTPSGVVRDTLIRIQTIAKQCNVNLSNEFKRLDLRKKGFLNLKLFKDGLSSIPIRLATNEINTMITFYTDPATQEVYYPHFCDDLENYGVHHPESDDEQQDEGNTSKPLSSEVITALQVLKAGLNMRCLTPEHLFIPHDKFKTGTMSQLEFRAAIQPIHFFVPDDKIRVLINEFSDQRQPEKVNYRRLLAILPEVEPTELDMARNSEIGHSLKGDEEDKLTVTNEIRAKLAARHKFISDYFKGITTKYISQTEFIRRIDATGLIFYDPQFQVLFRRYKGDGQFTCDWKRFCDDVESSGPILKE